MNEAEKEFYRQAFPILQRHQWEETGAYAYRLIWWHLALEQVNRAEIRIGLVVCPTSHHFCCKVSGIGWSSGCRLEANSSDDRALFAECLEKGRAIVQQHQEELEQQMQQYLLEQNP